VGKASNGTKSVSRIFGAIANGQYHQLHLRAYGGSEEKLAADFDAIAAGYKLLNANGAGGGGADTPATPNARAIRFSKRNFSWKLPPADTDATKPRWDPAADADAKPDR